MTARNRSLPLVLAWTWHALGGQYLIRREATVITAILRHRAQPDGDLYAQSKETHER